MRTPHTPIGCFEVDSNSALHEGSVDVLFDVQIGPPEKLSNGNPNETRKYAIADLHGDCLENEDKVSL